MGNGGRGFAKFLLWLASALATTFCFRYLYQVIGGERKVVCLSDFLMLFILPFLVALLFANIALNLQQGRAPFKLPSMFRYPARNRIRRLIYLLQLVAFAAISLILLSNQFLLFPQAADGSEELLLLPSPLQQAYRLFGVATHQDALQFVTSSFWGYFLLMLVIFSVYILYRGFIEERARSRVLHLYRTIVDLDLDLRDRNRELVNLNEQRDVASRALRRAIVDLKEVGTLGIMTRTLPRLLGPLYCGFLMVPNPTNPSAEFIGVETYCSDEDSLGPMVKLSRTHRPAVLDIAKLKVVWNSCFVNLDDGAQVFDSKKFQKVKESCLSASGMAFALEKPKVFNFTTRCLALCTSYQKKMMQINESLGRRLTFRSYLVVPVKHDTTIVAVLFLGSTSRYSFNPSLMNVYEDFSHALGQLMATLDHYHLLQTAEEVKAELQSLAKPYFRESVRKEIRKVLRDINRMLGKGDNYAVPFDTSSEPVPLN
jgi:hypothetical protein